MNQDFEDFFLSKKYDFFGGLVFYYFVFVLSCCVGGVTRSGKSGIDIFFADGYWWWSGDRNDIFGMTDGFLGMS